MTTYFVSETDKDKSPIGKKHGPFGTEAEAIEARNELAEQEAQRRITEKLTNPNRHQNPLASFGVFAEDS